MRTLSICKVQSFILFLRKSLTNRHLQTKAKSCNNEVKEALVQNGTSCLMANEQTFKTNNLRVDRQLRIYDTKQGLNSRRWAFHKWQDCTHSYWISWRRRASDKAVVRQLHCEQIKKDHYFLNNNPMFSKHCTSHFFLTSDLYLVFQPWELTSVNTVKFTSLSYLQLNLSFVNSPFPWSNVHK